MQITLNIGHRWKRYSFGGAIALALLAAPQCALAESAFVNQAGGGGFIGQLPFNGFNGPGPGNPGIAPEMFVPRQSGPNVAGSLTVGNYNSVIQIQAGSHDRSGVGILGGNHDSVNVLQAGNSLQSGVLLLGVSGLRMSVVQAPGAPPFGMVIAHLPNGGWFVRRR